MADLKAQLEISADASGVEAGVNKAKKSLATLGAAAQKEGAKASDGLEGIGDGGGRASAKIESATRNMIGSIQRTTAALEAGSRTGSKYFETLASQRGVSVDVLRPYLDQLDAVATKQKVATTAVAAASPVLKNIGVSAGQTAQALRQLPAQFSDIAVSLQAGQSPLTVFLQQGAQIKDSFGGIGPALRGVGGAVAGLLSPFALAAAAVGTLGFAYFQGSKEADAFAKALVLSGNAAGTTIGQLTEMAKSIDKVTGTQASASAALVEFASNGTIAAKNLEQFTLIALKLEREAGQAVKETVKQFAELGKEPVSASIKLNETTNFLTDSLYKQIRALDEQGRTAEAAAVAQKGYADALESRLGQLQTRLGLIERGWRSIIGAAKDAWDAMLNVGRSDTMQEQLSKAQGELSTRLQRNALPGAQANYEKGNQALKDRIGALSENIRLESRSANLQKEAGERVKARIEFDREADKFLSKRVQREREIAKANQLADKAGASAAERAKVIAGINDKYKDPKGPKAKDTTRVDDRAQALLDIADIKAKSDALINTYANTERILEAQRAAGLINETEYYAKKKELLGSNVQAQVDALNAENARLAKESLNTKDGLDRDRKVLENKQKIAKLTADATASQTILDIQSASALKQRESALLSATQAAQDYFDTINKQQDRELASFGKGNSQRSLDAGISQIEDRYAGQKRDLENNKAQLELEGKFTDDARKQYEARLQIITDFQSKSIASYEAYFEKRKAMEENFSLGAQEALANYADEAKNVFEQTNKAVTNAFKGMEDALVDFVKTGKLDFKSLISSILGDIARIAIKQNITGPLAEALGGQLSGKSSGGGSSDTGWIGSLLSLFGGVSGARAIGGPVSAGGMYRVNEKGPELLQIGNQQILRMGSQAGTVRPDQGGGGGMVYSPTFVLSEPASRRTQDQVSAKALMGAQRGFSRTK